MIFKPRAPNTSFVARIWSVERAVPPQSEVQEETNSSDVPPEDQSSVLVEVEPQSEDQTQPQDQQSTSGSQGRATTHYYDVTKPLTESYSPPELPHATSKKIQLSSQSRGLKTQSKMSTQPEGQRPEKRKRDLKVGSLAKRRSGCGQDPVVAPSTKPWPVFTIAKTPPEGSR